jgi:N-glycosylase/DNA lyase
VANFALAPVDLLTIKGVGEKVADCVLLFGYGRHESFPIDVWVRRVMERLYFDGKQTPASRIKGFAQERWGHHAGFAQQYLFHYIRNNPKENF